MESCSYLLLVCYILYMAAARQLITKLSRNPQCEQSIQSQRCFSLHKEHDKTDQYQRSSRQMCYHNELLDITDLLKVFV